MTVEAALRSSLSHCSGVARWVVAYSGGLDSHVLLHALAGLRAELKQPVVAIHVDHGLQIASVDWAQHCAQVCAKLGVSFRLQSVQVRSGGNLEARARQARYRAFEQFIVPGDCLLQAHHSNDQAETLLLRMLRGSGTRGLSAIPISRTLGRGMLFRPLLSLSRHQLEGYAQAQGLTWIEDPSNQALDFDRNFIRHEILPRLSERWPGCEFRLGRVAELCAETEQLNRELGRQDAGFCCSQDDRLSCGALGSLPPERQRNLIRYWLDRHKAPMPERKILDRILTEMVAARADAQPRVCWGGFELRRFRGELYLLRGSSEPVLESQEWDLKAPLVLPQGVLSAELLPGSDAGAGVGESEGGGLRMRPGQCVQVRFRQGGERCRLPGRPGHRSLKELLRCSRIPPWRREGLPLIYVDGELAAIADLWCCEGFELEPGEAGVRFKWSFRE